MFVSRIRAEDRSPWGDFWFEPVSARTLSGMRVSSDTAMQLSAVFRAVWLISGHTAMLPLVLKRSGTMERVKKHPLLKLFRKPNRWQNGFEYRQMLQGHLLLRGNAYSRINADRRGNITDLVPKHPDRVSVEMMPNGEDYRYRIKNQDGSEEIVPRGEMWHIRGLSTNGITGISVVDAARESMGLGLAAQGYGARFFQNDATPTGGWIELPGSFKDEAARQVFRESWQKAQAGKNRGKTAVLENGMKYHELGLTNRDAQFLETRKFQISEIARWFGVPPHMLADLERATFSNIEQQSLDYVNNCLLIWAKGWESSIEDGLLFDSDELDVEFDFGKLLRADNLGRAQANNIRIMNGSMSRNEGRIEDGREPLPGLDEPLRPLSMVEESEAEDQEEDLEAAEPPAQEATEPPDDDEAEGDAKPAPKRKPNAEARLQQVLASNAARIGRRIARTGNADPRVVSDALGVSAERAARWIAESRWSESTLTEQNITASLMALAAGE